MNEQEILNNPGLDQQTKLQMMKAHHKLHKQVSGVMGPKSYKLFRNLMTILVQQELDFKQK